MARTWAPTSGQTSSDSSPAETGRGERFVVFDEWLRSTFPATATPARVVVHGGRRTAIVPGAIPDAWQRSLADTVYRFSALSQIGDRWPPSKCARRSRAMALHMYYKVKLNGHALRGFLGQRADGRWQMAAWHRIHGSHSAHVGSHAG
jgi:hypothetical protein